MPPTEKQIAEAIEVLKAIAEDTSMQPLRHTAVMPARLTREVVGLYPHEKGAEIIIGSVKLLFHQRS